MLLQIGENHAGILRALCDDKNQAAQKEVEILNGLLHSANRDERMIGQVIALLFPL